MFHINILGTVKILVKIYKLNHYYYRLTYYPKCQIVVNGKHMRV